jgi:putative transposase
VTPPRRAYATDLTDAEWQLLAPFIPTPKPGGRPPLHDRRELVNAMAYWLRAGCAWRLLPHDLPPWPTVDHYFRCWRQQGLWEQIHHRLHVQERTRQGRPPTPSAAILDSQSVKTTERGATRLRRRQAAQRPQAPPAGRHPRPDLQSAPERGRCGRPRRRHGAAQAVGPPPVSPAAVRLGRWRLPRPVPGLDTPAPRHRLPGGAGPRWRTAAALASGRRDAADRVAVAVVPRRWVVERTFAWLGRFRRLSKDYEYLTATSEAVIYLAMTRLLTRP